MNHIKLTALLGLLAAGMLTLGLTIGTAGEKKEGANGAGNRHSHAFMDCARACDECARICTACAAHCTHMIAEGKKDHLKTLQTCQDCATHCSAASCIVARQGPFSDLICTACADACKRCGDACTKMKEDEMMRRCAEECFRCEKACRDMLQHTGHREKTGARTR